MSPNAELLDSKTHAFLKAHFGNDDYEVLALAGDASTRRYFRIIYNNESYVLMVRQPFADMDRLPFLDVRDHFEKHGVNVPKAFARSAEDGLILLDDLGDLTLERKFWENQNQSYAMPFYKKAIDAILKVHFPATKDRASNCVAFDVDFNVEKLLWEMNYGLKHFLQLYSKIEFTDEKKAALQTELRPSVQNFITNPNISVIAIIHSRNIMLPKGKLVLIDFQDARTGPVQYDLVSLLHDSYVNLKGEHRGELLDYYMEGAKAYGAEFQRDEFLRVYDIQKLQRCFKACGSFASFFNTREDTRYLKYLAKTIKRVRKTLTNFPEYKEFAAVIDENDLLNRDYRHLDNLQES